MRYGSIMGMMLRVAGFMTSHWCLMAQHTEAVPGLSFVVSGIVSHEQFGQTPFSRNYSFTARCQGSEWAVSCTENPPVAYKEILAVGNNDGVFIVLEMNTNVTSKIRTLGGDAGGGSRIANTSQAIVFASPVPSTSFAPSIGPIWITYLSSHYFQTVRTNMLPPPTELNVTGGSSVPPFYPVRLRSFWELDGDSKLPVAFYSVDDGAIRGIGRGGFGEFGRYPSPFDRGFTNIVFTVTERQSFRGHQLPNKAILDVFWVNGSKLERIHHFRLEALEFDESPKTPIPAPTIRGIAVVADERGMSSNTPTRVEYIATNRF